MSRKKSSKQDDTKIGVILLVLIIIAVPAIDSLGDEESIPVNSHPHCHDGIDNDGDGNTDLDDPDCQAQFSDGEFPLPQTS